MTWHCCLIEDWLSSCSNVFPEVTYCTCVCVAGAGVKMEHHFQAALDPRKQELLEARFLGARVSPSSHTFFIQFLWWSGQALCSPSTLTEAYSAPLDRSLDKPKPVPLRRSKSVFQILYTRPNAIAIKKKSPSPRTDCKVCTPDFHFFFSKGV